LPTFSPIMIVPTLDELAMMSVTDHCCTGWDSCSLKVASATRMELPTVSLSSGRTTPSSSAADRVMSLLTEPGS